MGRILVYSDCESGWPVALVEELSRRGEVTLILSREIGELEALLRLQACDVLLAIVDECPGEALSRVISKSRNVGGLLNLQFLSLHRRASPKGCRLALQLGAKMIFLEPVSAERVAQALLNASNRKSGGVRGDLHFYRIEPISCQIGVFGRIGKVFRAPLGDLRVETDVKFHKGALVSMNWKAAQDMKLTDDTFEVAAASSSDLYYNHRHGYRLSLRADAGAQAGFGEWMSSHGEAFIVPKTKVLDVGDQSLGPLDAAFDKKLFSLYALKPRYVTPEVLARISPKVVIVRTSDQGAIAVLKNWSSVSAPSTVFFTTLAECSKDWAFVSDSSVDSFKAEAISLLKPFLRERVTNALTEAHFISRNSEYSSCEIKFDGKVVALSRSGALIECNGLVEAGAVFQVNGSSLDDPYGTGLFAHVLDVRQLEVDGRCQLECEFLPVSDGFHKEIFPEDLIAPTDGSGAGVTTEGEKLPEWFRVIVAVCLLSGLIAAAIVYMPRHTIREIKPTGMDEMLRGVREAFQ
jgi:hypothetical protein